jgi:hypothetical protein
MEKFDVVIIGSGCPETPIRASFFLKNHITKKMNSAGCLISVASGKKPTSSDHFSSQEDQKHVTWMTTPMSILQDAPRWRDKDCEDSPAGAQ